MLPKGLRNRNPGNIRYSPSSPWQGLDSPPDDEGFCVFQQPVFGLRAMMIILRNYQTVDYLNTIRQIITRWAPAGDTNPVDNYVKYIAGRTFLDPDDCLDFTKMAFTIPVVRAMCEFEQGPQYITFEDELYQQAAKLAALK